MRNPLPYRRISQLYALEFADQTYTLCVGFYDDGKPGEVFIDSISAKEGSDLRAIMSDACVLISIALQHGISKAELTHSMGKVPKWVKGKEGEGAASILGAILEAIPEELND